MILTVTPNPALDLTYRVAALTPGETHRVPSAGERAGGKGLNVARVAHQTGADAIALSTVGGMTGQSVEAELVSSGLPHRLVRIAAPTRRSIAIVDETSGQATVLNERGSSNSAEEWADLLAVAAELAATSDCLVGSGSLPPGAPAGFYGSLVALAREHGIPSIIDATGEELLVAARAGATVLKPNQSELAASTGVSDPVGGARLLLEAGAGLVVVSLGADGMLVVSAHRDTVLHAKLDRPLSGNATGAGDAAVAAIAVALATGASITDSSALGAMLLRATAWSAAAVLAPLAGELAPGYAALESRVTLVEKEH